MKLICFTLLFVFIIHNGQCAKVATANVHINSAETGIGTILFYQQDQDAPVRIHGIIDGLTANTVHGFHVHRDALGEGEFNCTAAGPHFNPFETLHGPREASIKDRHVGDLGNVTANENGIIIAEFQDHILDLYDVQRSIANRTIVLHAMRDDGGKGGFPDSNTTGDAGARIACGVISLASNEWSATSNPYKISTTIHQFMKKLFS